MKHETHYLEMVLEQIILILNFTGFVVKYHLLSLSDSGLINGTLWVLSNLLNVQKLISRNSSLEIEMVVFKVLVLSPKMSV